MIDHSKRRFYPCRLISSVVTVLLLISSHVVAQSILNSQRYPYGWYDRTEDAASSALNMVAEGASIVLPYFSSEQDIPPYLDAAAERGLEIILPLDWDDVRFENQGDIQSFVSQYDSHTALYGWYLYEEADVGGVPVQATEAAYNTVKAGSSKPVFMSGTGYSVEHGTTIDFANSYDILLMVNYPFHTGNAEFSGLEEAGEPGGFAWNDKVVQLQTQMQQLGKAWWHVPQAFGQTPGKTWTNRLPTYEEERFIVYSSLLHGAEGQLAWAHYRAESTTTTVPTDPYPHGGIQWIDEVWEPIAAEFAVHGNALHAGEVTGLASSNRADILFKTYQDPDTGDYFLVALNNESGSENPTFSLNLPFTATAAIPIGEEGSPIAITSDQFSDLFSNYQAHVYQLVPSIPPQPPQAASTTLYVGSYALQQNKPSRLYGYGLASQEVETITGGYGLDKPHGGTVGPDGKLYVTNIVSGEVLRFDAATGDFLDVFTSGLALPLGITAGPDGNFYVALGDTSTVVKLDGATGVSSPFADSGIAGQDANGVVFAPDNNNPGEFDLFVTARGSNRTSRAVMRFDGETGDYVGNIIPGSQLSAPGALLFDGDFLYIADGGSNNIRRYDLQAESWLTLVPEDTDILINPTGMTLDTNGDLLVSSWGTDEVLRFDIDTGSYIDVFAADMLEPTFLATFTSEAATVFRWQADDSGSWGTADNWSFEGLAPPGGVANDNDHTAIFGGDITVDTTVVTNTDAIVNRIDFDNPANSYAVAGLGSVNLEANDEAVAPQINVIEGTHQFQVVVNLNSTTDVFTATATTLDFNHTLSLNGNNLNKTGEGTMNINNILSTGGGEVDCQQGTCGGSGTVAGDLTNSGGTVSPGNSPGVLEITGNFFQGAGGTLLVEISRAEHDVISVDGTIGLNGRLEVALLDGFGPSVGDSYDVLDFGSLAGEFDLVSLPALSGGFAWDLSRLYKDGSLRVVPEPGTASFSLMALMGWLCCNGRRIHTRITSTTRPLKLGNSSLHAVHLTADQKSVVEFLQISRSTVTNLIASSPIRRFL